MKNLLNECEYFETTGEKCDDIDCEYCCEHDFDWNEGGYCLNCGKHIND